MTEARDIQNYLEITCSTNPEEIIERINQLQVYMAYSGEQLANAKEGLATVKKSQLVKEIIEPLTKGVGLSATSQKEIIGTIAIEEQKMVDWWERINKSCTHQLDALRSLLSYEKEQLKFS